MRNIVPIGLERQVNFLEAGAPTNGVTGDQGHPEIAALPNGNFVVVYRNPYQGNFTDLDIMWQEFKADGTRLTGPTRLAGEPQNEVIGDVAARANNGFAAVWTDETSSSIELALVDPGVFTQPTEITVVDSATSLFSDPAIASLANGSYFIAYEERVGGITQLRFTIFNGAATTKIADNVLLEDGSTSRGAAMPSVSASGNNTIVAFYDADSSFPEDIRLKMFGPTGTLLDTETVSNTDDQLVNPDTATLKDGRVVIVWQVNTGTVANGGEVLGRIYDPATKSFSTAVFNIDTGSGSQTEPSVAALPDGGFVVTWTDSSLSLGDTSGEAIHARRFDSTGAPAGDEFLVNTRISGRQLESAVSVSANGRILAAWTSEDPNDGNGTGVQGRLMDAMIEPVNGTPNNDKLTTYNLSEIINGLAGGDAIDARGGNDLVNGGDGIDTLTGGPGADAFLFDLKPKKISNFDHITDFQAGADEFRLSQAVFKKLKIGDLNKKAFFARKKADEGHDGNDRIVYDEKSGECFYDKDGEGGKKAKLFAILDGSPDDLSYADFVVVA